MRLDLRLAMNSVSDVVQNRPQPLREFDQIYMKAGDLVVHAEFLARKLDGLNVAFVGDGDAVALAMVHLRGSEVIDYGPSAVTVFDFDERLVKSINKFAREYSYDHFVNAHLYNVIDALPANEVGRFDAFHTNPPWGQYNGGESAAIFLERGAQLIHGGGHGIVVIADDSDRPWAERVLSYCQKVALENELLVAEMIPALHSYHLDDAPDLRSCTMIFRSFGPTRTGTQRLEDSRLLNFYGRSGSPRVHYVRDVPRVGPGTADPKTYFFETLES